MDEMESRYSADEGKIIKLSSLNNECLKRSIAAKGF